MPAHGSQPLDPALLEECAGWIAAQMEEEGYLIDPGLVQLILEHEHGDSGPTPASLHAETARRVITALEDAGIHGIPETVNDRLVLTVFDWEDEFLSLAGRPRPPA
jgi:hypothetical protein